MHICSWSWSEEQFFVEDTLGSIEGKGIGKTGEIEEDQFGGWSQGKSGLS